VAATAGLFALGAYLSRNLGDGWAFALPNYVSIVCLKKSRSTGSFRCWDGCTTAGIRVQARRSSGMSSATRPFTCW
jgi:hypothetical protein